MFRIVRFPTGLLAASILMACGYFNDDPPYPPLEKEKLVGCWTFAMPKKIGLECSEKCFSAAGLYYSRSNDVGWSSGERGFVESAGSYTIKKNTARLLVKYGNNVEVTDTVAQRVDVAYTIMRDTLFSITDNGSNLMPLVRADSSNTCGPHWQVFPEPEGWDLN